MKRIIACIVFCLAASSFAASQPNLPELEKIKRIKLLESTREEVRRIFGDEDDDLEGDFYSTDEMSIHIMYSNGDCSDEDWNVPKGKAIQINVRLSEPVDPKDLKIDLSKLERIKKHEDDEDKTESDPDDFIYFVNDKSVSYGLSDGKIKNIKFIPAEKNYTALCSNEGLRKFKSAKDWFLYKITRRPTEEAGVSYANVSELNLNRNEIIADCPTEKAEPENFSDRMKVAIATKGESREPTDVITFTYTVSGGRIIGQGANVIWDLSGVKPGKYTLTAGADNGYGIRPGTTKTETVVVKEFADCRKK